LTIDIEFQSFVPGPAVSQVLPEIQLRRRATRGLIALANLLLLVPLLHPSPFSRAQFQPGVYRGVGSRSSFRATKGDRPVQRLNG
jgi:hypothetical protein